MKKYEEQAREAVVEIINLLFPEGEGDERLYKAAEELGMSKETARQARSRSHQKGSVETYGSLILKGLNSSPSDFKKHLPKLRKIFTNKERLTIIEELFEEVRNSFTDDEVIAWLRLLLARYEIELEIGIRKKPGRPKVKL